MKKTTVFLSFLSAGFLILILVLTNESTIPVSAVQDTNNHGNIQNAEEIAQEGLELSHEKTIYLTEGFIDTLVQETDITGKTIHVNTVEELLKEFEDVATEEAVLPYIEFYYTEEKDGLYLLPTETPPWFIPENEYELNQVSPKKIILTQENTLDLYGDYTIEIEFIHTDEWKISNITHR